MMVLVVIVSIESTNFHSDDSDVLHCFGVDHRQRGYIDLPSQHLETL